MSQGNQMKSQIKIVFRPPLVFLIVLGFSFVDPRSIKFGTGKSKDSYTGTKNLRNTAAGGRCAYPSVR